MIGTLGAIVGILMLTGGCVLLIVSVMADVGKMWGLNSLLGLFAIMIMVIGTLSLVTSIGLLRMKNWARVVGIVGSGLGLLSVMTGFKVLPTSPHTVMFLILRSAFDICLLIYLLTPEVKRAFGATGF